MKNSSKLIRRVNFKVLIYVVSVLFILQPWLVLPLNLAFASEQDPPATEQGEVGDDGNGGRDAIIYTGDADVGLDVENDVNQNDTTVGSSDNSGSEEGSEDGDDISSTEGTTEGEGSNDEQGSEQGEKKP